MQPLRVLAAIGQIVRLFSVTYSLPILVALAYDPWDSSLFYLLPVPGMVWPFALAMIFCLGLSYFLEAVTKKVETEDLQDKEAYLTVGIGWLVLTVLAALPFWASGVLPHFYDAFFEAMSGITTTGATAIAGELEAVPKSIMIWRAFLQYLGGMGIIVLSVALLARLTQGGLQLLQAEAPGPSVTRVRPKLAQTAKTLWGVYGILSAVLFILLLLVMRFHVADMTWGSAFYDALLHTFTTLSTGGFSNHTVGISFFDSWLTEVVLILFMLIAGSNFTLHYYAMKGDWRRLVRDREWRMFMGIFLGATVFSTLFLWGAGGRLGLSLREAAFTVASLGTSTGFSTANYDLWPDPVRILLIVLMFTGATAGSTAGGMKVVRILLLMKVVSREFKKLLHPRAVIPIRLGGRPLKEDTVMTVVAFFFSYLTIWMVGSIFLIATDPLLDAFDGAVAAASAMGNVGPAMGALDPTMNFSGLLPSSKIIIALLMWIGRLEVFTALILFAPQTWKN